MTSVACMLPPVCSSRSIQARAVTCDKPAHGSRFLQYEDIYFNLQALMPASAYPDNLKFTVGTVKSLNGAPKAISPSLCNAQALRRKASSVSLPAKRNQVP